MKRCFHCGSLIWFFQNSEQCKVGTINDEDNLKDFHVSCHIDYLDEQEDRQRREKRNAQARERRKNKKLTQEIQSTEQMEAPVPQVQEGVQNE